MSKCYKCNCKAQVLRDDEYDAYYCLKCGAWQEDKCSDYYCEFCANRPAKKSLVR